MIILEAKTLEGDIIEFELEDLFSEGNICDRVFLRCPLREALFYR